MNNAETDSLLDPNAAYLLSITDIWALNKLARDRNEETIREIIRKEKLKMDRIDALDELIFNRALPQVS